MTSDHADARPVQTVLVIGAGVAGGAAAFWLDHHGFDVTMIEKQATTEFDVGYLTDVNALGVDMLKRMGLLDAVREQAVSDPRLRMSVTRNNYVDLPLPSQTTVVSRGVVTQLVHDAAASRVRVTAGTTVTRIEDHPDGVEVTFDDGGTARFDLVVGADGLHSRTRRQIFGEDDTALTRRDLHTIWINVATTDELRSFAATMCYEGDVVTLAYPDRTQHLVCVTTSQPPGDDIESLRSYAAEVIRAGGKAIRPFADAVAVSDDVYLTPFAQVRLDTWSRGRVVLVGDAAHCLDPLSGQGTNTALLGGYTLAGELRRAAGDHEQALRAYEDRLRPYTRLSQEIVAAGALYEAASGLRERLPMVAKGLAEVASTIAGMRPREVLGALRTRPQEYGPHNLA